MTVRAILIIFLNNKASDFVHCNIIWWTHNTIIIIAYELYMHACTTQWLHNTLDYEYYVLIITCNIIDTCY